MAKISTPAYRRQKRSKATDLAFVELNGRRHYLGAYDSEESHRAYHELLARWSAGGRQPLDVPKTSLTVVELFARFWEHAQEYYRRPDGSPTGRAEVFRYALRPMKELFGARSVAEIGALELKAVREQMIEKGASRSYVNECTRNIRHVFRWGVGEDLVPPAVLQALEAVRGLKAGRTKAHELPPIVPVPEKHIEAVRPHVSRQVWAMIQLQLVTAARSGEIVVLRPQDLDMTGKVWTYTPEKHKTAHHGTKRVIYLGPKAQAIVRPFLLGRPRDAYLFSPADAEAERLARRNAARKTPLCHGNRPGTNREAEPKRKPGERYYPNTYRNAIARACKTAGVPSWHPHRLRHNAATMLRREFGIEIARVILGHRSPLVTEIYAELDREKAVAVMERIG